ECAIHALAPTCAQCGIRIVGHGLEKEGTFFCCEHCAERAGVTGLRDRVGRRVNVLLVLANFFRSSPRKRGPMITALWSWAPARARSARLAETTAERDADRVGAAA